MNTERLSLMATMLDEVSSGAWLPTDTPKAFAGIEAIEFNLSTWACMGKCGYTACAIGHAMLDKRFDLYGGGLNSGPMLETLGGISVGWKAVENYFDIELDTAIYLFSPEKYEAKDATSASQVAERIRGLIA